MQLQSSAMVDLVLEDVQFVEPATMLVGPAYRIKFRNQSRQSVGEFSVAIFAGVDGKIAENAPRAIADVSGMLGGEVSEVTLRLPATAMKLASAHTPKRAGFSHLFVAIDATDVIPELDEANNVAVIERSALETAAQ